MIQERLDHRSSRSSDGAIRAAAREVLGRDPSASMTEIALRAGVGRATLHRHFASREDLLRAVSLDALDATDAALAGVPQDAGAAEQLRGMFDALLPLGAHFHFLARCSVEDAEVRERYARQVRELRDFVEALRADGTLAADVPIEWAVALIDGLIWIGWNAVGQGDLTARQASAWCMRSLLRGIGEER